MIKMVADPGKGVLDGALGWCLYYVLFYGSIVSIEGTTYRFHGLLDRVYLTSFFFIKADRLHKKNTIFEENYLLGVIFV